MGEEDEGDGTAIPALSVLGVYGVGVSVGADGSFRFRRIGCANSSNFA